MDPTVISDCPCHSGRSYADCCLTIHRDYRLAASPVQLMRARYAAYVLSDSDFLLNTWARDTRPDHLDLDSSTRWLSLEIIKADPVNRDTTLAKVTFVARFITSKNLTTLRECSSFIKRSGCWYYLEGVPEINRETVSGKAKCPCGSGGKFKRCCMKH